MNRFLIMVYLESNIQQGSLLALCRAEIAHLVSSLICCLFETFRWLEMRCAIWNFWNFLKLLKLCSWNFSNLKLCGSLNYMKLLKCSLRTKKFQLTLNLEVINLLVHRVNSVVSNHSFGCCQHWCFIFFLQSLMLLNTVSIKVCLYQSLIGELKSYLSGLPQLHINVWVYFGRLFLTLSWIKCRKCHHT